MTGLHGAAVSHFAKRSADVLFSGSADLSMPEHGKPQNPFGDISALPMMVIGFTILIAFLVILSVRYTLWGVVTTLACVEQPTPEYQVVGTRVTPDGEVETDTEVVALTKKPITSSIRGTLRHLKEVGGRRSRWRGLGLFLVIVLAEVVITSILSSLIELVLPRAGYYVLTPVVAPIAAAVVLARFQTTWTHIVISEPSPKRWTQRIAPAYTIKNVWLPTVVAGVAAHLSIWGPATVFSFVTQQSDGEKPAVLFGKSMGVLLTGLVIFIGLALPAQVTLVRVQASMLAEEDEAIVPFDRSFGGRVTPRIVGGRGALDMVSAWKSFDGPARIRILRLFGKIFLIEIGLHLVFGLIIFVEIAAMVGLHKNKMHTLVSQ